MVPFTVLSKYYNPQVWIGGSAILWGIFSSSMVSEWPHITDFLTTQYDSRLRTTLKVFSSLGWVSASLKLHSDLRLYCTYVSLSTVTRGSALTPFLPSILLYQGRIWDTGRFLVWFRCRCWCIRWPACLRNPESQDIHCKLETVVHHRGRPPNFPILFAYQHCNRVFQQCFLGFCACLFYLEDPNPRAF